MRHEPDDDERAREALVTEFVWTALHREEAGAGGWGDAKYVLLPDLCQHRGVAGRCLLCRRGEP